MIKLGWMARATDAEVFEEQVKFASDLDLDVIDFHLGGMPREMDFIMKIKMRCVRAGLPIGYLGGGSMVGPPEEREQRLAKGREDVEIASVSFCMTGEQALRILSEVNKDNLTFLWDTGQWLGSIGSDPRGEFDPKVDIYEDYLVPTAFCASSVRAKIYQIDTGVETYLDYPRIFKILQDVGYNGNISIVYEGAEGRNTCTREEGIALGAKYLRKVIGEVYR
jgi:sugar phosphate isomerase/epimerase